MDGIKESRKDVGTKEEKGRKEGYRNKGRRQEERKEGRKEERKEGRHVRVLLGTQFPQENPERKNVRRADVLGGGCVVFDLHELRCHVLARPHQKGLLQGLRVEIVVGHA
jgi:hypothetical protein